MPVYKDQGIDWQSQSDSLGVSPLKWTHSTRTFVSGLCCLVEDLRQLICFIGCFSITIGIDDRTAVNSATVHQSQPTLHTSSCAQGMLYCIACPILIAITVGNSDTATQQQQAHTSDFSGSSQPHFPVQPEDIVDTHCQHNHTPCLPSNIQLLAARQQQTLSTRQVTGEALHNGDGQEPPTASGTSQEPPITSRTSQEPTTTSGTSQGPTTASKSGHLVHPTLEHAEPWQLHLYDPPTHDIIKCAKQFSHCNVASIDSFPVCPVFNIKAIKYINEAIAKHQS